MNKRIFHHPLHKDFIWEMREKLNEELNYNIHIEIYWECVDTVEEIISAKIYRKIYFNLGL